jgi:hypothetical protein
MRISVRHVDAADSSHFDIAPDATVGHLADLLAASINIESDALRFLCRGKILTPALKLRYVRPDAVCPVIYTIKKSHPLANSANRKSPIPSPQTADSPRRIVAKTATAPKTPPRDPEPRKARSSADPGSLLSEDRIAQSLKELHGMGFTDDTVCLEALEAFSGHVQLAAELITGGDLSTEAAERIGGQYIAYTFGSDEGLKLIRRLLQQTTRGCARGRAVVNNREIFWTVNGLMMNGFLKHFWSTTIDDFCAQGFKILTPPKVDVGQGLEKMWETVFHSMLPGLQQEILMLVTGGCTLATAVQLYVLADCNLYQVFRMMQQVA